MVWLGKTVVITRNVAAYANLHCSREPLPLTLQIPSIPKILLDKFNMMVYNVSINKSIFLRSINEH